VGGSLSTRADASKHGGDFRKIIQDDLNLAIAGRIWQPWLVFRRCVSGNVRRCFPFLHVIDDILVIKNLARVSAVQKSVGFRPLARYPFLRCSPICFGTVEVYRRTCCCNPPFVIDPDDLPIEVNRLPDSAEDPFARSAHTRPTRRRPSSATVLTGGRSTTQDCALQARRCRRICRRSCVRTPRSPSALCATADRRRMDMVSSDGGSFSVCWKEPPTILLHCHEELAYVVKPIGGVWRHLQRPCRQPVVPRIGSANAHQLSQ
jgi:hypothetical protein